MAQTIEDSEELARFREEWRLEVRRNREARARQQTGQDERQPSGSKAPDVRATRPQVQQESTSSVHAARTDTGKNSFDHTALPPVVHRALDIYERAVACEQRSEIDEALRLYRLAFRIYDRVGRIYEQIEHHGFHVTITDATKPNESEETASVAETAGSPAGDGMEQVTQVVEGLTITSPALNRKTAADPLADIVSHWPGDLSFERENELEPVHLKVMPDELLVKVMGYLSVTALERFAAVCRKTRVLTLDVSIWRQRVTAIYRPPQIPDGETIVSLVKKHMGDPRRVYIEQPRVRLDGVYIAVCHYIRPGLGESAWVNVSHLITYHRYLRFYPTGQVLSLLTNEGEAPQQSIHKLQLTSQAKSLYIGSWRLEGTTVIITDLLEVLGDSPRYTFQMTLELRSRPLGRWNRLTMQTYETVAIADGDTSALPLKNERPFWFSKVRSFS